ncbi:hypothetical protein MC378_07375 [Polaribacter sp. MSW13]|uniref:Uncharacterized protein n=1 Tax=Polaribacter marinus TaxID=2916838 RepID=A0A9X1VNS4_9FLAO|nr:hypothetical protein [Polaribacter marinus]MCI2228983.1 hypothetical protein [Polaribacter marinus]
MTANEDHYLLHWQFFKENNPKSDELFFIKHQLKKEKKCLKKLYKEVDFSDDRNETIEDFKNKQNRIDYFFHRDYKKLLENKLKEKKSFENNILPKIENCIIIHYGCSNFEDLKNQIFWIGAIHYNPTKSYFFVNDNEVKMIEKLRDFIDTHQNKTFIHWSMNSPKFGFTSLQNRYLELTKNEIKLKPLKEIDLSEFLKSKYGINYIERKNGRLNNLAKLNDFSGAQSDIEVININDATNRLELIFSIVQAEVQNELKTLKPKQIEIKKSDEVKDKHPKHEPNLWSLDCFKLFKYLFDNYYQDSQKPTKRQLTNIWFYLNEYDKIKYNLKATKDSYKDFIKRNYKIELKNFDKAPHKYQSEYGTMNDHRINYEDNI